MNNQMMGTSIKDLHEMEKMDNFGGIRNLQDNNNYQQLPQFQQLPNIQFMQNQNPNPNSNQNIQFPPIYNPTIPNLTQNQPNYQYSQTSQSSQSHHPQYFQQEEQDIGNIVKNINETLQNDIDLMDDDIEQENSKNVNKENKSQTKTEKKNSKSSNILSGLPNWLKESLLILIIYLLLSQEIVKETIGKYIRQINPDIDGKVSFTGVLIYGIILVVLYILAKFYLLK